MKTLKTWLTTGILLFTASMSVVAETQYFCRTCPDPNLLRNCTRDITRNDNGTVTIGPASCGGCGACYV